MRTHDLVVQENTDFDHFNTGWMWLRRGQAVSEAWAQVVEMDKVSVSRDQNRFNEVLGTAELRAHHDIQNPHRLLQEFVSLQGLRVHVLSAANFYAWHFERDAARWPRHESVGMHITCGDDETIKIYMLKALGYWPDTQGYYSSPANILSIDALGGTQIEVTQMVRIALAVAYYSQRSLQPPTHAVFTDVREPGTNDTVPSSISSLPIYSSFPFSHIERHFKGKLPIVEPMYAANAAKHLLGGSVHGFGQTKLTLHDEWEKGQKRASDALDLLNPTIIDVRQFGSLGELIQVAMAFSDTGHVKLVGFNLATPDSSGDSSLTIEALRTPPKKGVPAPPVEHWMDWPVPEPVARLRTCHELGRPPGCSTICRWRKGQQFRPDIRGEWPSAETIVKNEGWGVLHWSETPPDPDPKEIAG